MKQNGTLNEKEQETLDEVERRWHLGGEDAPFFLAVRNLIVAGMNAASDNWEARNE